MIQPERKDWTWVLERPCPSCSFDASACTGPMVPDLVRANVTGWERLLAAGAIRAGRPNDTTWSSLEYTCHVRDVFRRFDGRLDLMLREDDATFPNWDQDATAVEDRYEEQDPPRVVAEMRAAGEQIASRLDQVPVDGWDRPGRRNDGATFTVDTISRYLTHDVVHHAWDVARAQA